MSKTRIGVIGTGYLGKFHARKYAAMADVDLVGVADPVIEVARTVAAENNTRFFDDYRQLLPLVDAVSIVVPTSLHYQVAKDCLNNNVDIMLEKPMTTDIEEADELIALGTAKNKIIQVGHLEQFNPAIMAMEKHLTTPIFIESHRIHTFKNRALDVDVVLDLMIHDIDIILGIVKSPLETVHTVGLPVVTNATDIANARLIFANGCTANVTVSRISQDNIRRLRIFQPQSFISVDYGKKELLVITQEKEVGEDGMPRRNITNSCYMEIDALEMELRNFVENVRNRSRPKVSGVEGRRALKVATEIINQIRNHLATHGQELGVTS